MVSAVHVSPISVSSARCCSSGLCSRLSIQEFCSKLVRMSSRTPKLQPCSLPTQWSRDDAGSDHRAICCGC